MRDGRDYNFNDFAAAELLIPKQKEDGEINLCKKAKEFAIRIMDKPNPTVQELTILPDILELCFEQEKW